MNEVVIFLALAHHKIVRVVIQTVLIPVVDLFSWLQGATNCLFSNEQMLQDLPNRVGSGISWPFNQSVSPCRSTICGQVLCAHRARFKVDGIRSLRHEPVRPQTLNVVGVQMPHRNRHPGYVLGEMLLECGAGWHLASHPVWRR